MKKTEKNSPQSNRDKGKRFHLGVHEFFKSRSGRNFLLFLEVLLAISFFAQPQLYYDGSVTNFFDRFYADSLIICGALFAALVYLTIFSFEVKPGTNKILTILLGPVMPFLCLLWLELYNNEQFWVPIFTIPPKYFILNLLLYYVVFLLLLLLCNSIRNASITMIVLTSLFGFFNYELTLFRGMSFIASDIFSVLTAATVANTYRIQMDVPSAEFLLLTLVIIAALLKLDKRKLFHVRGRLIYAMVCIVMCIGVCQVYVFSSYLEKIGVDFRVYRPQYKYRYYGTLLTTARTFGYLHVSKPEGYSTEKVKRLMENVEKEDEAQKTETSYPKNPNIIVIMNESFADLKEIGDMDLSNDYMPYFRKLKNCIKGYTYSSVFGGNTANSEFEFLTGNTLAFLPDNSVPYQLFLRDKIAGLTSTLKMQGYSPCDALHPFYNTGYSRYKIYPLMGFDRFYTSDDFSVFTDTVNYHITDEEDYNKIIQLYEASKSDDKPFYMFNVTMQNHGSYDGSLYETGDSVRLQGEFRYYSRVNQYLNMVKMSDQALKKLVKYFEKEKEPTVIVFFGDHQPDLDESFYNALLKKDISELEGEELETLYKVPFLIWANYDIKDQNVERTSNNYLSTYLAEITGMKTTAYLDYLKDLRKDIPAINALGYWGADGRYYDINDTASPYYDKLQEYRFIQYNNIFGKEEQISSFFYPKEEDN